MALPKDISFSCPPIESSKEFIVEIDKLHPPLFSTVLEQQSSPVLLDTVKTSPLPFTDSFLLQTTELSYQDHPEGSSDKKPLFGMPTLGSETEVKLASIPILEGKLHYLMMQYMVFDTLFETYLTNITGSLSSIKDALSTILGPIAPTQTIEASVLKAAIRKVIGSYSHEDLNFSTQKGAYLNNFSTIYTNALFSLQTLENNGSAWPSGSI